VQLTCRVLLRTSCSLNWRTKWWSYDTALSLHTLSCMRRGNIYKYKCMLKIFDAVSLVHLHKIVNYRWNFRMLRSLMHNIKLQPSVAPRSYDFAFRCFSAVYVQHRLIYSDRFLFIVTTCFGLTYHHQLHRLLWWRNLRLTEMLFCFPYVVTLD
jgi:hypothetical protein